MSFTRPRASSTRSNRRARLMLIGTNVKAFPLGDNENVRSIDGTDLCINYRHLAWRALCH